MRKKSHRNNEDAKLEIFESHYLKLSKRIMCFSGLWPYQSSWERNLRATLIVTLCGTGVIPQILAAYKFYSNFHRGKFFRACTTLLYFSNSIMRFIIPFLMSKKLKVIFKMIDDNWKIIIDKVEVAELKRHSEFGRFLFFVYFVYMVVGTSIYTSVPAFIPIMMDFINPLDNNCSRHKLWILEGQYLIDTDDNYYKLYTLEAGSTWSSIIILLSIEAAYIVTINHSIALIGVLNFSKTVEDFFTLIFIVLEVFTLMWISVGCNVMLAYKGVPTEFYRFILVFVGVLINLFYLSYQGQILINSSENTFNEMFNTEWYRRSLKVQKLILMMMTRSVIPLRVTAGGFHPIDFENFGRMINTAASYITILASLTVSEED